MNRDRAAMLYEEALGEDARRRQAAEALARHVCCGELVSEGHHYACSKRPEDEPPAHVDGQESLL